MRYQVLPSKLSGAITIPPSKSHSLRAILFASFAKGASLVHGALDSPDRQAMIHACRLIGAQIQEHVGSLDIEGVNGQPAPASEVIDVGNSGQVLRFMGAMAALSPTYTVLTGDHAIRTLRPVAPLLSGLQGLGAFAVSTRGHGYAPIVVRGLLKPGVTRLHGQDSQPVSGLLMACAFLKGESLIQVDEPGETPWVELTLDWFRRLGIAYTHTNYTQYQMKGFAEYEGFQYTVPADFSSAAFPMVAALITRSPLTLLGLDRQDIQGDKKIIHLLEAMGASFEWDEATHALHVKPQAAYQAAVINVNALIDALPILTVMACCAEGETRITGAGIARFKESDRLHAITTELRKMGAQIEAHAEGLTIQGGLLHGAVVHSHHDHRIAMALSVAGMVAKGETIIENCTCVSKSYPHFAQAMQSIGAQITW